MVWHLFGRWWLWWLWFILLFLPSAQHIQWI
jgi:hypothetical protein